MAKRTVSTAAYEYVRERALAGRFRPDTAREIRYVLIGFARSCDDPPIERVRQRHVIEFVGQGSPSPGYRRNRFTFVRRFSLWALERRLIGRDWTLGMAAPREPRRLPRALTINDARRLFAASPDARMDLILLLGLQEGLRRGEIARLEIGDVDFAGGLLRVHGKGGHERLLPLSNETVAAMGCYLAEHPAGSGPLIRSYTRPNRPLSGQRIGTMVRELMVAAGVKERPLDGRSLHALRHTMATDMLRGGAHVRDVQHALGHKLLQTTQIYMPLVVNDLREAMAGRNYRNALVVGSEAATSDE